jgi:HD superfamily phosphohydrolase
MGVVGTVEPGHVGSAAVPSPYNNDGRAKTFTLPASGSVVLYGPEIDVVQTRTFQRLGGIKQLGTSYVVFRGALHTRFEHSIGALHQAERMVDAIRSNPREPYAVDPAAHRLARLGALLHDLPHVPFGHTLEDEFHLLVRHDKNAYRTKALLTEGEIGAILQAAIGDDEFGELCCVLAAKKDGELAALRYPFVGDIVGNTVCADLLDYVVRDLVACGMPVALGDRFLDYLTVTSDEEAGALDRRRLVLNLDKRGMPRPDVESEVVKLLEYRYELAERVYFHHAKNSASVMIGRAVQEAGWATGPDTPDELDANFHWLSDEMLLRALADPAIEAALNLNVAAVGNRALAAELATRVLDRDLFKIAYLAVHDDVADGTARICEQYGESPTGRKMLEDRFASAAGLPPGAVLVHVPRQKMMTKDADVRVRTSGREVIKLHEWDTRHSRRVEALNQAHARLWRVTVYIDPRYLDAVEIVRAAAVDEFRAASRYVERDGGSAYVDEVFRVLSADWELGLQDREALASVPLKRDDDVSLEATKAAVLEQIGLFREEKGQAPLKQREA